MCVARGGNVERTQEIRTVDINFSAAALAENTHVNVLLPAPRSVSWKKTNSSRYNNDTQ
jgi:hypothetical protein